MTDTQSPSSRAEPFPVQAAKFSLYAPIVVMLLGCIINAGVNKSVTAPSNTDMARVTTLIVSLISLLVLVFALVLGVIALFSIRKYGAGKILGRAAIGTVLNSLFLAGVIYSFFFFAHLPPKKAPPIDRSLTTAEYISKGVPDPLHPWTAVELKKAAAVLEAAATVDAEALPRYKSPRSGDLFDRISSEDNLRSLTGDVRQRFTAEVHLGGALSPVMKTYVEAQHHGAHYPDELAELIRFNLQMLIRIDADMRAVAGAIPEGDARRAAANAQVEATGEMIAGVIDVSLDSLADKNIPTETMTRLIGYEANSIPALWSAIPAGHTAALLQKAADMEANESDATAKAEYHRLNAALSAANAARKQPAP